MPTFFSKILNLGKDKEKKAESGTKEPLSPTSPRSGGKRLSIHSLLEGKFEAVSPTVSEQGELAPKEQEGKSLEETDAEKERGKDKHVSLLPKPKARTKSPTRRADDFPRLTLNLTLPSISDGERKGGVRDLRTVLEGTVDGAPLLDDSTLGRTRLSPSEALKLMKACAGVINERGLDTLGIMHPHWHSASPQLQRRLLSLFMNAVGHPESSKAQAAFEDGMEYTRSPYDIASVFRWALRHLQLEGHSFASAKDAESSVSGPLSWYGAFVDDERTSDYPHTAFSTILLPRVKAPHVELLLLTADLMSVLAAHSEANSVSGSKLSMSLGQYLLIGSQDTGEVRWRDFYERWEDSGRALEHIFLCYLRNETSKGKIPKRVQELVAGYPYAKYAIENDSRFPRPARFATRSYDALHILITCEMPEASKFRDEHSYPLPLSIIENALKSDVPEDGNALERLWGQMKASANAVQTEDEVLEGKAQDQRNLLSRIFSDESIRLLGLRSDYSEQSNKGTPLITMFSQVPGEARVYSIAQSMSSATDVTNGKGKESANGISRETSEATAASTTLGGPTPISPIVEDWNAFSSSGFGEDVLGSKFASTLMDSDVEKTQPTPERHRSLKRSGSKSHKGERAKSRERSGRKTNVTPLAGSEEVQKSSTPSSEPRWKTSSVSVIKMDEAFVDFWADALLDPITRPWPSFVVCQLKSNVSAETESGQKIGWLVVEQTFVDPPRPPTPVEEERAVRASSPKPSISSDTKRPGPVGRVSSTFKRFALFGSGTSYADEKTGAKKPRGKDVRVNEMGEIIYEETASPPTSPVRATRSKAEKRASVQPKEGPSDKKVAAAAAAAVGGVAVASALNQVAEALKPEAETKQDSIAPVTNTAVAEESASPAAQLESNKVGEAPVVAPSVEKPASILADAKPENNLLEAATAEGDVAPIAMSQEQEVAEEAAVQTTTEAVAPEAVVETDDKSQPERQIAGDQSAAETTIAPISELPAQSPRSPGPAGDSLFVEHLESSPEAPEVADDEAHPETVTEASESPAVEEASEVNNGEVPVVADSSSPAVPPPEEAIAEKTVEVPTTVTEPVDEHMQQNIDETIVEAPVVLTSTKSESIQEAAAVEDPAVEEPAIEQPTIEQPSAVEPTSVEPADEAGPANESVAQLSVQEADEPVPEAAAPSQVVHEEPVQEAAAAAIAESGPVAEPSTVESVVEPAAADDSQPAPHDATDAQGEGPEFGAQQVSQVVEPATVLDDSNVDESVADAPAVEPILEEEPIDAPIEPINAKLPVSDVSEVAQDSEATVVEDPVTKAEVEESDVAEEVAEERTSEPHAPVEVFEAEEPVMHHEDEVPAAAPVEPLETPSSTQQEDTQPSELSEAEVAKAASVPELATDEPSAVVSSEEPPAEESTSVVPASSERETQEDVAAAEATLLTTGGDLAQDSITLEEPTVQVEAEQPHVEELTTETPEVEDLIPATPAVVSAAELPVEENLAVGETLEDSASNVPVVDESLTTAQVVADADSPADEVVATEPTVETIDTAVEEASHAQVEEPSVEAPMAEQVSAEETAEVSAPTEHSVEAPAALNPVSDAELTSDVPVIEDSATSDPDAASVPEVLETSTPDVSTVQSSAPAESVIDESTLGAYAVEEPTVETQTIETHGEESTTEANGVVQPIVEESHEASPIIETPPVQSRSDEAAVADTAQTTVELTGPSLGGPAETQAPTELPAEELARVQESHDMETSVAATAAPVEDIDPSEKAASVPEPNQVSFPVDAGDVETTVHHEVPVVEEIISGLPEAGDEGLAPAEVVPPAEEQIDDHEAAQSSEQVEPDQLHTGNGTADENAKAVAGNLPVLSEHPQPSEPTAEVPTAESTTTDET